jgi:hypothetical protein
MSKEFNYERAWKEYVKPEYDKLYPSISAALSLTQQHVHQLQQIGANHQLSGITEEISKAYDAIPTEILAVASQVVYYYGHFASDQSLQDGGLYWKFQILAHASLAKRKDAYGPDSPCDNARRTMDTALNQFDDHKEGTEYNDDEVPSYLLSHYPDLNNDVVTILKVQHVNHKPDVFCIGPQHMKLSQGMYLDPTVAPCAVCKSPYSEHTSDRAMFVKVLDEDKEKLGGALTKIKDACAALNIKIDGFTLVKA